jgi:hypothetical protein
MGGRFRSFACIGRGYARQGSPPGKTAQATRMTAAQPNQIGFKAAVELLAKHHQEAEREKRFGRVIVELAYKAGQVQLIEGTRRFTEPVAR